MLSTFFKRNSSKHKRGMNRRDLLRQSGLLTAAGMLPGAAMASKPGPAANSDPIQASHELYHSIGVNPVINSRGTFTIISGSQTLPEVKEAMDEASRSYVQVDELMGGVSKKLAELT